jgi:hypothetical protein
MIKCSPLTTGAQGGATVKGTGKLRGSGLTVGHFVPTAGSVDEPGMNRENCDVLHSIVIALDGFPSSLQAARLGLELACGHQAHVEGLGIANSAWIQHPEAVPIDGMAYTTVLNLEEP